MHWQGPGPSPEAWIQPGIAEHRTNIAIFSLIQYTPIARPYGIWWLNGRVQMKLLFGYKNVYLAFS